VWLASHICMGAVLYEGTKAERKWLCWLLVCIGGFVSHWLLDSVPVVHTLEILPKPWLGLILFWNFAAVAGLWWLCTLRKRRFRKLIPPNHILAGLVAWLIWDIEHLFGIGSPLHQTLLGLTATPKIENPSNCILELLFIMIGVLVAAPILLRRRSG